MESTSVWVESLVCVTCGKAMTRGLLGIVSPLRRLRNAEGRCSTCKGGRFNVVFTVRRAFLEGLSAGRLAGAVILTVLSCGFLIFIPVLSSGDSQRRLQLRAVEGSTILVKMELPPQTTIDWIVVAMKDEVKANLGPDQGICLQCEGIYTRGRGGYTTEGYCSPNCKTVNQKPPTRAVAQYSAPTETASATCVDCPHCGRKVNVKPGGGKCMYCGKTVQV